MKKRCLFLFIMICSMAFLVGWGKKKVELLNDKKLIDLNAAIEKCMPGGNSMTKPDASDSASDGSPEKQTLAEAAPGGETEAEVRERILVITVRDQTITYDAKQYTDLSKLKAKIRQDNGEHVSFRLVDDFAESHVYKAVLTILSDLQAEIGLNYTKE